MPDYQINTSRTFEDKNLISAWNELYKKGNYMPQSCYEWMSVWWKHFSDKSHSLFIVTVERNEKIIGIAPFMIEKQALFSQLKMVGSGLTDYHEILTVPEDAEKIIQHIIEYVTSCKKYDLINLEQIPDYSPAFSLLKDRAHKREMIKCPIINFNSSTWDEYKSKLSRLLRKKWVNKRNRLSRMGHLEVEELTDSEKKPAILDKLFALHAKRWEFAGFPSKLSNEALQEFLTEILSVMSETCIFLLKIDDKILAYDIGFVKDFCFYDWNGSFDPTYSDFSPGTLLTGLIFKSLIERKFTCCNFMRGNYTFKRRWMTDDHTIGNYQYLIPITTIKGGLAVRYYMKYKWWIRKNVFSLFGERKVRKLVSKIKS
jgi:CelD/BcsL family acetyltransferase involved in cellulose biosynthesis